MRFITQTSSQQNGSPGCSELQSITPAAIIPKDQALITVFHADVYNVTQLCANTVQRLAFADASAHPRCARHTLSFFDVSDAATNSLSAFMCVST